MLAANANADTTRSNTAVRKTLRTIVQLVYYGCGLVTGFVSACQELFLVQAAGVRAAASQTPITTGHSCHGWNERCTPSGEGHPCSSAALGRHDRGRRAPGVCLAARVDGNGSTCWVSQVH